MIRHEKKSYIQHIVYYESIRRGNFAKYLFLGYGFLEIRICCYKILRKLSWKIWYVLMVFLSPGKSYVCNFGQDLFGKFNPFLWYFFLLENRMCSCRVSRKLFWKFWCVLVHFASPGKILCVFVPFLVLLKILTCSYKRIMSSPGKIKVFLLHPGLLESLMCSGNLFTKVAPGRKEQIF